MRSIRACGLGDLAGKAVHTWASMVLQREDSLLAALELFKLVLKWSGLLRQSKETTLMRHGSRVRQWPVRKL